ncbi:hypothetical protein BT63DRAFT_15626 [Microthyrium microscopicum]|uniref:C3H1-type domain-containing protein n=1 Tax=Microthyrium microscopicum TaxID=703497 RepID=A0A6A6UQQ7_9PEZI|nr:hypothetical protein BT63DRAFT_15626 [Microthyrium microscopicum]
MPPSPTSSKLYFLELPNGWRIPLTTISVDSRCTVFSADETYGMKLNVDHGNPHGPSDPPTPPKTFLAPDALVRAQASSADALQSVFSASPPGEKNLLKQFDLSPKRPTFHWPSNPIPEPTKPTASAPFQLPRAREDSDCPTFDDASLPNFSSRVARPKGTDGDSMRQALDGFARGTDRLPGARSVGFSSTLPPSGVLPNPKSKVWCTHYLRHGECDYIQQGCIYKHDMPELAVLKDITGLKTYPQWWQEKQAKERRVRPMGLDRGMPTNSLHDSVSERPLVRRGSSEGHQTTDGSAKAAEGPRISKSRPRVLPPRPMTPVQIDPPSPVLATSKTASATPNTIKIEGRQEAKTELPRNPIEDRHDPKPTSKTTPFNFWSKPFGTTPAPHVHIMANSPHVLFDQAESASTFALAEIAAARRDNNLPARPPKPDPIPSSRGLGSSKFAEQPCLLSDQIAATPCPSPENSDRGDRMGRQSDARKKKTVHLVRASGMGGSSAGVRRYNGGDKSQPLIDTRSK